MAKLIVKQNGRVNELANTQHPIIVEANAQTNFQLIDEHGNVIRHFDTQVLDGKLLIDLPNTTVSPDFVINNYGNYFGNTGVSSNGSFGAADTTATPTSTAVKAETIGSVGKGIVLGALGLATIGGVMATKGSGGSDDSSSSSSSSGSTDTSGSGSSGSSDSSSGSSDGSGSSSSGSTDTSSGGSSGSTDGSGSSSTTTTTVKTMEKILNGNSIVLPEKYLEYYRAGDMDALFKIESEGSLNNGFTYNQTETYISTDDLNNLPAHIQKELSLFTIGLLNPLREQLGVGLLKVTEGSLNLARDIANKYTEQNLGFSKIYTEGINEVAPNYGLQTKTSETQDYEILGGELRNISLLTLNDLKAEIYNYIETILFNVRTTTWDEIRAFLNPYDDNTTEYFAVDFSNPVDSSQMTIHFITASERDASDVSTFNSTIANTEEVTSVVTVSAAHILPDEPPTLAEIAEPQVAEKFVFSKLLDGGIRQLSDEYDAEDVLVLDNSVFTALSEDKSNLTQHISYNSKTGELQYDADGATGSEPAVVIAQLPAGLQENQLNFEVI